MLTNNNTPKYTDDKLRDDWDARIENAQHSAFKRRHAAVMDEPDTAKRDALWARISAPRHHWFSAELERSVTEQAPLVIECLDDVRDRAMRLLARQLLFLPRGILQSAELAPYLERWRLGASVQALLRLAASRARCAYQTLDLILFCVARRLCLFSWQRLSLVHHYHRRRAAACIYDAPPISTTGKKDMDPGASSSAGLWAARALPAAAWRPACPFPYMRQHADAIAKATVDWVFAVVPGLDKNELRARFAGVTLPGSTWKPFPPPPGPVLDGAGGGGAHHGAGV
jgi:hypothetical protein